MKAYHGKPRKRRIIGNDLATAGDMIGPIEPGCEIACMTAGQYGFIEILNHLLNQIGPSHCIICTWTANYMNIKKAMSFCRDSRLLSCKWMADKSFASRKPDLANHLVTYFGERCIFTAANHGKFILLYNDAYSLVLRTSMNLDEPPMIEFFQISDDRDFLEYVLECCATIFSSSTVSAKKKDKQKTGLIEIKI